MAPKSIIITGAGQGIGRALSQKFATDGVSLGLVDLDQVGLEETAEACRSAGASVLTGHVDICDRRAIKSWARAFDRDHRVDLIIANAGISPATAKYGPNENPMMAAKIVEVNLIGAINTLNCLLPQMVQRKNGQVALMASIAAYIATGDSPSYCASKAGILAYGRGMRHRLRPAGIKVSVVCPGYVETRLTSGFSHAKDKRMTAEVAADKIIAGLHKNKAEIAFPTNMYLISRLVYALPESVRRLFIDKFQY